MKNLILAVLIAFFSLAAVSKEKRDILQKEGEQVHLAAVLIKDFSKIGFPEYHDPFWKNLPAHLKEKYTEEAEEVLDYNWPVVKATDYLEIIRSGDRRQGVYAAPSRTLQALVMGELAEGEIY